MLVKALLYSSVFMLVILTYTLICERNPYFMKLTKAPDTLYQLQTDGFLHKQLSLNLEAPIGLKKLPNPYDHISNVKYRVTIATQTNHGYFINQRSINDFTYYNQKLYSCFGPLPILTLILPFKIITDYYLSEVDAILFFLIIAFLFQFILLKNIRDRFFKNISEFELMIVGIAIGITNNSIFLLMRPRFYELAIASAYCMVSISLIFLYRSMLAKPRVINIFFFSLFLSLAVAGRPTFAIACFSMLIGTSIWIIKCSPYKNKAYALAALLFPMIAVCFALAYYNYLRFDSIFEFGQNYMLSGTLINNGTNSLFNFEHLGRSILHGLYYYLFSKYDNLNFNENYGILLVIRPEYYYIDSIAGALSTASYILFCLFLLVFIKNKLKTIQPLLQFILLYSLVPISVFIFLCTLNGTSQRYISDFLPYLCTLAILSVWLLQYKFVNQYQYLVIKTLFMLILIYNTAFCLFYAITNHMKFVYLL